MRLSRSTLATAVVAACAAVAAWIYFHRRDSTPLTFPAASFASWTIVVSDGTDPWIVGAAPGAPLTAGLLELASERAGRALVPPPHTAVPLVLQSEFADSLQGVYGTDAIVRLAREEGLETAPFYPVCLARQTVETPEGRADIYFVPLEAAAFNQLRADLTPLEPEHAGIGVYDPGLLSPALPVGATAGSFAGVWPIVFDKDRDCEAPIALTAR
jgi:hypothetical protein